MKQTEKYGLNLLEMKDTISPVPLNENVQAIETVLKTLSSAADGHLKIACGSYTGTGSTSVTIQTPGLKAKAMLVRERHAIGYSGHRLYPGWGIQTHTDKLETEGGWLLWFGWDIPVTYSYVTEYDDDGKYVDGKEVETTVKFEPTLGKLKWSVTGERSGEFPSLVNNKNGYTYDWIALGTAGE